MRAKKTLAAYKALAKAGEPELVPELPKGQTKVEPGKAWAGVPQLAARLRVFGDLPAGAAVTGTTYSAPLVAAVKRSRAVTSSTPTASSAPERSGRST